METKLKLIQILEEKAVHLRELSRLLKTGMPNIIRYISILEKEQVIKKEKEANLVRIKLNNHVRTIAYLKQINTEKFLALPSKIQAAINDFLEELAVKPLITIIFGSYAKGDYTKASDIDLLLVFQKAEGDIESLANKISMRTNTQINPIYINYEDFKKNFLNKDHEFSRELREKVIILQGAGYYYELLWRFRE